MSSVQSLLLGALDELEEKDVKRFKWNLSHNVPEGFRHIPRGQLEKQDVMDVVDLVVDSYGGEGALRITLHVLQKMNQNEIAERLEREKIIICHHFKSSLRKKFEFVYEGIAKRGNQVPLKNIYTEMYITEGETEGINNEHEVRQIETASKKHAPQDTLVSYNDIFRALPHQKTPIRTVLTKGIAGIGKTFSVQKFILDWAEAKANEDIDLIFVLPFRKLNLIMDEQYSLQGLVHYFHPEMKEIESFESNGCRVLFIFDGLDESRLLLDFEHNQNWYDIKGTTSVDILLTNLIVGNLCHSAFVWITTRPAAANRIPPEYIQQVTEVRGFNDLQKEDYFRKKVPDQSVADSIIRHIKSARSLYIMCHIPIFCWIAATVLERMLGHSDSSDTPKTLTQLYTHFLLIVLAKKGPSFPRGKDGDRTSLSDKEIILKLGDLALQHLQKGNLIFYEEDLRECGISVSEVAEYSGLITEIYDEASEVNRVKMFRFIHLSIQEYLAALFVFLSFRHGNRNPLDQTIKGKFTRFMKRESLYDLHKIAVDKALQSKNGHLDLFLRFLLGLSMDSIQTLLRGLTAQPLVTDSQSAQETARYIKKLIKKKSSPERVINLFHCLNELNDSSLVQEIKTFLSQGNIPSGQLSSVQCSALAYVLLMSEEELGVLDLKQYKTSHKGLMRLLPVVKYSRGAVLDGCNLSLECCEVLASAISSGPSDLRELDLSNNDLRNTGVKLLSAGLGNSYCKLQALRLDGCNISLECCEVLASAISSEPTDLRELDLSNNDLGNAGVKLLSAGLGTPQCRLKVLRLAGCGITCDCCGNLASTALSISSNLRELDLSDNDLQDAGVKLLSPALGNPHCELEKLSLSLCGVRDDGCWHLTSALRSNPSHLRELDLSYNYPDESALALLSTVQADPSHSLQTLLVDYNGGCRKRQRLLKYACALTVDPNTVYRELCLSDGGRKITRSDEEQPHPDHPERFNDVCQALCREGLSGRCYWETDWTTHLGCIGVAYKGIGRKGKGRECCLGLNDKSWSLDLINGSYFAWHNNKRTLMFARSRLAHRVGMYLDWPAGTLSFYSVSSDTLSLLYTFHATFTEPLYLTLWIYHGTSVSLCRPE
ncbi:NACHT, LRR and PYD domains-containing protein 12-like [Megalops cyprinoides]|uniref:NACHT, LRR and PYD domains-containing protein 12-like n=1 Tax=Megalops cyprinoides TaxID=118141 RepID=UPI001864B6E8|nr:NACHT, LRR and PYD domains-containing protein 12-like [Megalops cyprinoides]